MEDNEHRSMSLCATREEFTLALVSSVKTAAEKLHSGLSGGGPSKIELAALWVDLVLASDLLFQESPTMQRLILRENQADALRLMLGHYGDDPRVQCLRELLEDE